MYGGAGVQEVEGGGGDTQTMVLIYYHCELEELICNIPDIEEQENGGCQQDCYW